MTSQAFKDSVCILGEVVGKGLPADFLMMFMSLC